MKDLSTFKFKDVIEHHINCGKNHNLNDEILYGQKSHAEKWHAYSIVQHIIQVTGIAYGLWQKKLVDKLLIKAAMWHDIGKTICVQNTSSGVKFHGHQIEGAEYLSKNGTFNNFILDSIRFHGDLKNDFNVILQQNSIQLLLELELCDELGKWNQVQFPPKGSERNHNQREQLLSKIYERGIDKRTIICAVELSQNHYGKEFINQTFELL